MSNERDGQDIAIPQDLAKEDNVSDSDDTSDDRALLPFADGGDGSASRLIRRQWHDGRWFFSVVDVIAVLTDSDAPGTYWGMMKQRLAKDEGFIEVFTKCEKLKMCALDGKMRPTDAADVETMLRIMQSVPSPKVEPVRQWLAQVGAQRLEEVAAALGEDQRRQLLREEIAEKNRSLAGTVTGLVSSPRVISPSSRITATWDSTRVRRAATSPRIRGWRAVSMSWIGWEVRSWPRTGSALRRQRRS